MTTNDGNRTNLASSKIQTSRSWNYWFESNFKWLYGSLSVIGKRKTDLQICTTLYKFVISSLRFRNNVEAGLA